MKSLRKQRTKKKLAETKLREEMTPEEIKARIQQKHTNKNLATSILWDYDHKQLPKTKKTWVIDILELRLKELEDKDFMERRKIEVLLNDFRR